MPSQYEDDRDLVQALCNIDHGLTDWEVGFVESIAKWVDERPLTDAQRERAESILAEKG